MKSGIYAIKNTVTGKSYVGSAVLFSRRFSQHRHELTRGTHHSIKLQRAWDKHGAEAFVFEVLEYVSAPTDLVAREQYWIDEHQSAGVNGYNVLVIAGTSLGYRHDETARQKMKGRKLSAEQRAQISAISAQRSYSEETREKISKAQKGRPKSDETKARMKAAKAGRKCKPRTPEHIAKHAASLRASNEARRLARQAQSV